MQRQVLLTFLGLLILFDHPKASMAVARAQDDNSSRRIPWNAKHSASNFPFDKRLVLVTADHSIQGGPPELKVSAGDTRASAKMWCNFGNFRMLVTEGRLRIGDISSTLVACKMLPDEEKMLSILRDAEWKMDGDKLRISNQFGDLLYTVE